MDNAEHILRIDPLVLPDVIPIFPLSGVMVMPRCHLPLNIFEPRYVHMVLDALGHHRLIGVVQPKGVDLDSNAPPEIYHVGCLGKITQFEETRDNRLQILLQGITRFVIEEELPASYKGYRMARVRWADYMLDFAESDTSAIPRPDLIQQVVDYAEFRKLELEKKAVTSIPTDLLVDVLSMTLPFGVQEKQALVESRDVVERAKMLMGLMQMEMLTPPSLDKNTKINRQ